MGEGELTLFMQGMLVIVMLPNVFLLMNLQLNLSPSISLLQLEILTITLNGDT